MRDLRLSTMTSADGPTEEDKRQWKLLCESYLFGQEQVAKFKKPVCNRVVAFDHGLAVDNALKLATGSGLKAFQEVEGEEPDFDQPVLTIAMDQGSIGMSWMWYAINKIRLRIHPLWDPSHRMWNDVRGALSAAGCWPFILIHTILLNLFLGPWNGSQWWEELCEAARLYFQESGSNDALFQHYLPALIVELGMTDKAADPGIGEEIFQMMKEAKIWKSRGSKVSLGRWFNVLERSAEYDKEWTIIALVMTYLGLQLGFATKKDNALIRAKMDKALMKAPKSANTSKVPMARSTSQIQELRQACKTSCTFACCC